MGADTDLLVTAWLRPKTGGDIDFAAAGALGATPPLHRTYSDRTALAQQTAADPADVERLRAYCQRFGLRLERERWRSAVIAGPIDAMVEAFGATVAVFEDDVQRRFRHRSLALHAPVPIAHIVRGAFGFHQWPRSKRLSALSRHATPLSAAAVAARYDFPECDGTGQTIAVLQMHGSFDAADFDRCMTAQSVRRERPIVKSVDDAAAAHEHATMKDLEATLDVQIAGALAPGARIVAYQAPNDERGFLDGVRDAIFDDEHPPAVLSISYGWPEALWTPAALEILTELFAVAALCGISVFCSSGDGGAELDDAGNAHVVAPASSPFAAACGATVIGDDGTERAWENTGGGFSARFQPGPWQRCAHVSAAHYGVGPGRGVPDVAAQEYPGYFVVMQGTELAMGGTSAVAPVWSALTARINQRLGVPAGFFLPLLYGAGNQETLRAVTAGNNGRFHARAGWNPCTGLGVAAGTALEEALRRAPRQSP